MRLLVATTHPIQYQAPLFRELARRGDLLVLFAHRATPDDQARAGFGVRFDWDVDLTSGFGHRFLENRARRPGIDRFLGTDCPEIPSILASYRPDAVLVMGWHHRSYWQCIRAARRSGIPVLVRGESQLATPRSLAVRLAKEVAYRGMLRAFDGFCFIGHRNRAYLEHYGARSDRLFFSPYCVDNAWFEAQARTVHHRAVRADLALPADRRTVLFCGKLIDKKRPLDLIRALARLPAHLRPVLIVVGSGPLEGAVRVEAAAAGVEMRHLGFQNQTDMPRWYALADLLVLPSDGGETWGLVVNEAMACGTPAVVSDAVGCGPDLVEPGATGETFPVGDTDGLARVIVKAIGLKDQPTTALALRRKMLDYSIGRAADGIEQAVELLSKTLSARSV